MSSLTLTFLAFGAALIVATLIALRSILR